MSDPFNSPDAIFDQNPEGADQQLFGYTTLARVYVHQGKDTEAQATVNEAIELFADDPNALAYHLFGVPEEYYLRAGELLKNNNFGDAASAYKKATELWQKPPVVSNNKVPGMLSACYQQLKLPQLSTAFYNKAILMNPATGKNEGFVMPLAGDRYCGAYAVWHLLKHYGKTVSIETIANQMSISQKGYATIQDIVDALKTYDLSASPMRMQTDKASQISTPFIQYLIPLGDNTLGHFVLVLPTGSGKAVVLDGLKVPLMIDLTSYQNNEAFWDGTIILIEQSRQDYLGQLISRQLLWQTAVAAGNCWLEDNSQECLQMTVNFCNGIIEQQMAKLRGGWDLDCLPNGQTCYTNIPCDNNSDCPLAQYVCDDKTIGKRCLRNPPGIFPCTDLTVPHQCLPQQRLTGICDVVNGWCEVYNQGNDPCGQLTVPRCRNW